MEKERKRSKKYLIIILLILAYCSYYRVNGNVFDKIYWAKEHGFRKFMRIEELKTDGHGKDYEFLAAVEDIGVAMFDYKEEFLRKDIESVTILTGRKGDKEIGITLKKSLSDTMCMYVKMEYDYSKRTLTYSPVWFYEEVEGSLIGNRHTNSIVLKYMEEYGITEEDIREYQNYALYDVVVKTWVKGNGGIEWYEAWKIKRCRKIDNTFAFTNGRT